VWVGQDLFHRQRNVASYIYTDIIARNDPVIDIRLGVRPAVVYVAAEDHLGLLGYSVSHGHVVGIPLLVPVRRRNVSEEDAILQHAVYPLVLGQQPSIELAVVVATNENDFSIQTLAEASPVAPVRHSEVSAMDDGIVLAYNRIPATYKLAVHRILVRLPVGLEEGAGAVEDDVGVTKVT